MTKKAKMAAWSSGIYATCVLLLSLFLCTRAESCAYKFDVWYPDRDVLNKLQVVEFKISNLTSYVDLEILKLKHTDLHELKCLQNKTHVLELELIKSKLKEFKDNSTKSDSKQCDEQQLQLNNLTERLIQLENKFFKRGGRKSRIKQERALGDRDHVTMNTIWASVSDLRSEWIMIKRDIFDIHKEIAYLKKDHNDVTNLTNHIQATSEMLKKTVESFKSSLEHSSQTIRILHSNFDTLKQIVSSRKDEQLQAEFKTMTKDFRDIKEQLQAYKLNASSLEKVVEKMVSTRSISNSRASDTPASNRTMPTDCDDVFTFGYSSSGVHRIQPTGSRHPFNVYCDFSQGSLLVIQRREDGLQNFDRNWLEYKFGFGSLYGDFWLGNELIYQITNQRKYGLLITLEDWEGKSGWAEYSGFELEDHTNQYTLRVSGYSGNAGDSLGYHNGMKFSTEDTDNDLNMRNCAAENRAGWWFDSCYLSNLNGVYHKGWYTQTQSSNSDGIVWFTWKDSEKYSLKKVEMKLKRV